MRCWRNAIGVRAFVFEYRTHVRIRIGQYFTPAQINDLDLDGPRLQSMNDEYYYDSPVLWERLKFAKFNCLVFSEGLLDLPENTGKTLTKKETDPPTVNHGRLPTI